MLKRGKSNLTKSALNLIRDIDTYQSSQVDTSHMDIDFDHLLLGDDNTLKMNKMMDNVDKINSVLKRKQTPDTYGGIRRIPSRNHPL